MPGERPHPQEKNWAEIERKHREIDGKLWNLVANFAKGSNEEIKVRTAITEDWDLAAKMTLLSELTAKWERINKSIEK